MGEKKSVVLLFTCVDGDGVAVFDSVRLTPEAAKMVQGFVETLPETDCE